MALNFMVRTVPSAEFLLPLFNQRNDRWGGDLEGRMRFPLAVLQEVKNVVYEYATKPFAIGYRISPEESVTGAADRGYL